MKNKKYGRKIIRYLIKGRLSKVKRYIKKKKLESNDFVFKDGDSLLHKLSYYGYLSLIRKYTKDTSLLMRPNPSNGKLPCHQAILGAMQRANDLGDHVSSTKTILFLKQASPASFKATDHLGVSADYLYEMYKIQCRNVKRTGSKTQHTTTTRKRKNFNDDESDDDDDDDDDDDSDDNDVDDESEDDDDAADVRWNERMEREMYFGQDNCQEDYLNSFSDNIETDTWGRWADGIREQYHKKHEAKNKNHHFSYSKSKLFNRSEQSTNSKSSTSSSSSSAPKNHAKIDPERIDRFNEEMRKRHKEAEKQAATVQRLQHEQQCESFFSNVTSSETSIGYNDIPWPFPLGGGVVDAKQFIFSHLESGSEEFQRVLRRNQVRWHPDRFMHRCGGRITPADEGLVAATVKQLSQFFNGLSSDMDTTA